MATDPKPDDAIMYIGTKRTIRKTDAGGPKTANFLEMQRGMLMVFFQQCEAFVRKFLDNLRQRSIANPKFRGGEVFQISLHFPASKDLSAASAKASNLPT